MWLSLCALLCVFLSSVLLLCLKVKPHTPVVGNPLPTSPLSYPEQDLQGTEVTLCCRNHSGLPWASRTQGMIASESQAVASPICCY